MGPTPSRPLAVTFTSPRSPNPTRGEVRVQSFDPKLRLRRALKTWGTCWGLAIVAVFIPGMHFILVPSALLAGPVLAAVVYQQRTMILGGSGTCPACGQPFEVLRSPLRWPINDVCAKCHDAVTISPTEA